MKTGTFRVDSKMIAPIVLAMIFGMVLVIQEGTKKAFLLLIILSPFFYLGIEILARRITLDEDKLVVRKFLRQVELGWSEIQNVDAIVSGAKVFIVIQSDRLRPILVTNTISPFKELGLSILEKAPADNISPYAREVLGKPSTKAGPLIQAWLICLLLFFLAAVKWMGYSDFIGF